MLGTSLLDRLRQRDPGYAVLRRAARLTLVASVVFYACRYGLGSTVLATYALFGTIATGVFAQLPGPAGLRARTLLTALPVAWALIAAGTLLARDTWAAAAGMLVVGFAVAFAGSVARAWSGWPVRSSSSTSWPASRRTSPAPCRRGSAA